MAVVADCGQRAGAVVHDERGAPHGIADPHGQVESEHVPVRDRGARRRADREGERPARSQHAVHPLEQCRPFGGQEVPECSEGDREIEDLSERSGPGVGPHPRGVRMRATRLREHAGAPWHRDLRTSMPAPVPRAHVQSMAERPEFGQGVGGRAENVVRGAKGRVVELRSQEVVARSSGSPPRPQKGRGHGPAGWRPGRGQCAHVRVEALAFVVG